MYQDGQIITKEEHVEFANWTNTNGGKFYSEPNGDGTYTVREVAVVEPTTDEIASQKRVERNSILSQTDKYMIVDFPISDKDRETMKQYRQYLRDYTKQKDWWKRSPDNFADYRANIAKVDTETEK